MHEGGEKEAIHNTEEIKDEPNLLPAISGRSPSNRVKRMETPSDFHIDGLGDHDRRRSPTRFM